MIIFVIGPCCAGKSTFIKNNYKNSNVIDLYDFQKNINILNIDDIWNTYIKCKDELRKLILSKDRTPNIILEHTLLKAERRKFYIDEIKKITKEPIIVYSIFPKDEEYKKRLIQRGFYDWKQQIKINKEIYEKPVSSEGFSEIHIIE